MIRTVIIDDEKGARTVLRELLTRLCPQVEIVGEADAVDNGISLINQKDPDLVLLDVEMPGGSGFNILEGVAEASFKTIFITAFDQYSLKALKASALDYILKPVNSSELIQAIEKAEHGEKQADQIASFMTNIQSDNGIKKIAITTTGKINFIDIDTIVRCEAEGSYTYIHQSNGMKTLSSKPIREFEELLEGRNFFRIHRSHLINLQMVKQYIKGELDIIVMKDDSRVEITRKKRSNFMKAMEKVYL